MKKENFSEDEFSFNALPEQLIAVTEQLRGRSFYAPVLIDTFFEQVEAESLVAKKDWRYGFCSIGGRIKDHPRGYIRLWWETNSSPDQLKMEISVFNPKDKENERDSLIYGEGHQSKLTIESNGKAFAAFAGYIGDSKWEQETISNLTVSFYPSRWQVAPTNPSESFTYWLLTRFVPDFLENKVAPLAHVPREEMTGSVIIDDPEP